MASKKLFLLAVISAILSVAFVFLFFRYNLIFTIRNNLSEEVEVRSIKFGVANTQLFSCSLKPKESASFFSFPVKRTEVIDLVYADSESKIRKASCLVDVGGVDQCVIHVVGPDLIDCSECVNR